MVHLLGHHLPALPVQELKSETICRSEEVREAHAKDKLIHPIVHAAAGLGLLKAQTQLEDPLFSENYNVPALLAMHGKDDVIIPYQSSIWLIDHATNVEDRSLKLWDNLYHELVNEPERNNVW
eukprot:CAMPEP_0117423624 /NCGR_PEP_ID=MMETSP0758-20121206/4197_1 /TAXON_ID=63605 /ORGANISM="Percolomonas cosmopolitus, Strain AE-1 (ATCC 50343)" /LENGTH=122 /DNA_ID=CAMNT_0005206897 /DNA_START=602 /DNA_END=967 /DNA_ORIENTATION=-